MTAICMPPNFCDKFFMSIALKEAKLAGMAGDVPVGAVAICNGKIIAKSHNRREIDQDATAHAEIIILQKVCRKKKCWRLDDVTIYVTLEPCPMCAGALVLARVKRLVYAASDPRMGAVDSLYAITNDNRLNHQLTVTGGVLAYESSVLLKDFFLQCRK